MRLARVMAGMLLLGSGSSFAGPPDNVDPLPLPVPTPEETAQVAPPTHFMTTVQFAVLERTAHLTQRSQKLVMDQFADVLDTWPEFSGRRYELKTNGAEVVLYVTAPQDIRKPMEKAVTYMIQNLNGKVRGRGRTQFYKTSLEAPAGGFLEVRTDAANRRILSVVAQSVPLRDILKEIKMQLGGLSYLIPGDCAAQPVDWSFGEDGFEAPKTLDEAMGEIGSLFKLRLEKHNHTYVFSGRCEGTSLPTVRPVRRAPPMEPDFWTDLPGPQPTAVFFPLPPLPR